MKTMSYTDKRYYEHAGPRAISLGWRQKWVIDHVIAQAARSFEDMERELAKDEDYDSGPSEWEDFIQGGLDYLNDIITLDCEFYSEQLTSEQRAIVLPRHHRAVVAYLKATQDYHIRRARLAHDQCPGCGCGPGDGLTENCNDAHGCGHWKQFVNRPRIIPISQS